MNDGEIARNPLVESSAETGEYRSVLEKEQKSTS